MSLLYYFKRAFFVKGAVKGFSKMKRNFLKCAKKIAIGDIKRSYGPSGNMWLHFEFKIKGYEEVFFAVWDIYETGGAYLSCLLNHIELCTGGWSEPAEQCDIADFISKNIQNFLDSLDASKNEEFKKNYELSKTL